jgi:hypothetical protein
MNQKHYSDEEAREILKRAVDYEECDAFQYSGNELLDMGREMGLSEAAIVKAEAAIRTGQATRVRDDHTLGVEDADLVTAEKRYRHQRLQELYLNLAVFVGVMSLLVVLNFMAGMTFTWVAIVLVCWGGSLIGQYLTLRRPEGEAYEKGFNDWLEKREGQVRKRQRWAQRLKEE